MSYICSKPGYMRNAFLLFLFFGFGSCRSQSPVIEKLGPDEFEKGLSSGPVQILDVRTAAEFKTGHIKNALQADWTQQQQFLDRIQYVDKDKPVFIYCLVGGRSAAAADWMRKNGYTRVSELTGGINSWKRAGKPLEGSSTEPQLSLAQYEASIPKDKTTLVDVGATWCPPCIKMQPVVDELEKTMGPDKVLLKIDAGVHTDLLKALGIEPIPVFIIYKQGKEVWRKQGIVSKEELLSQLQ